MPTSNNNGNNGIIENSCDSKTPYLNELTILNAYGNYVAARFANENIQSDEHPLSILTFHEFREKFIGVSGLNAGQSARRSFLNRRTVD